MKKKIKRILLTTLIVFLILITSFILCAVYLFHYTPGSLSADRMQDRTIIKLENVSSFKDVENIAHQMALRKFDEVSLFSIDWNCKSYDEFINGKGGFRFFTTKLLKTPTNPDFMVCAQSKLI